VTFIPAESGGMTEEALVMRVEEQPPVICKTIILKSNLSKVRVRLRKAKADFDREKAAQTPKAEEQRIL
jgi:hypothetical protein